MDWPLRGRGRHGGSAANVRTGRRARAQNPRNRFRHQGASARCTAEAGERRKRRGRTRAVRLCHGAPYVFSRLSCERPQPYSAGHDPPTHRLAYLSCSVLGMCLVARGEAGSPSSYLIAVSNEKSGDVTFIDGGSRQVVATVAVGHRPRGIHPSPDGRFVYVAISGTEAEGPPEGRGGHGRGRGRRARPATRPLVRAANDAAQTAATS